MTLAREELLEYFSRLRVDVSEIEDDTPLFSSGTVDSFAIVELLLFLEPHVGRALGPEDINLDNLDSIGRILSFVERESAA